MNNQHAIIHKNTIPYQWIEINNVFTGGIGKILADSYPTDNYRTVSSNKGRIQHFDIRPLVIDYYKGANIHALPNTWQWFAQWLTCIEYQKWLFSLTGIDVSKLPMEASIFKYTKDSIMDAHTDLPLKVLTQVFYFNTEWDPADGGCFCVLNSKNEQDVYKKVLPVVGNSSIIVRSDNSWHSVDKMLVDKSRRSVVVAFYQEGCTQGRWWIEGQPYELHDNFL